MNASKLSIAARRVRRSGPIFGILHRIAQLHLGSRDPLRQLLREQFVRDAHLVAVRVTAEGSQRRVLRLPAESADTRLPGPDVRHDRGRAADAVAIAIVGIRERQDRVVGNRLDETGAERRNGNTPDDDVGFGRNARLAVVRRCREQLKQRVERRAVGQR